MNTQELFEKNKDNPKSEFHYYKSFEYWLMDYMKNKAGKGHKTTICLPVYRGGINELDIVGGYQHKNNKRKYTLFSIEVKMVDAKTAIDQARRRKIFCDYVYIAFPVEKLAVLDTCFYYADRIKKFGIGILFYDTKRQRCFIAREARQETPISEELKEKIVRYLWFDEPLFLSKEEEQQEVVLSHKISEFFDLGGAD